MPSSRCLRRPVARAATLLLLLLLAACERSPSSRPVIAVDGLAMGTSWNVKVAAPPAGFAQEAVGEALVGRLEAIEQAMSTYRPDSALSRFNAYTGDDWFAVPAELCFVVETGMAISRASGGAFDVTVGPLVDLWGFGPGEPVESPPEPGVLASVRRNVGFEKLEVDCARPALRKTMPGVHVDLSAIAKGYAVDALAELLAGEGVQDYLVEIGGEVRAKGRNAAGEPWTIGIEAPDRGDRRVQRIVRLPDLAMATSGDYRNYFEADGRFYSHTIDPRTGAPVQHDLAEVSVVTSTTIEADAWATTLLVLGTADGQALAEQIGLAVLFLERRPDGVREIETPGFAALSQVPAPVH